MISNERVFHIVEIEILRLSSEWFRLFSGSRSMSITHFKLKISISTQRKQSTEVWSVTLVDTHIDSDAIYGQELTWRPIFGHVSVELDVVFVILVDEIEERGRRGWRGRAGRKSARGEPGEPGGRKEIEREIKMGKIWKSNEQETLLKRVARLPWHCTIYLFWDHKYSSIPLNRRAC